MLEHGQDGRIIATHLGNNLACKRRILLSFACVIWAPSFLWAFHQVNPLPYNATVHYNGLPISLRRLFEEKACSMVGAGKSTSPRGKLYCKVLWALAFHLVCECTAHNEYGFMVACAASYYTVSLLKLIIDDDETGIVECLTQSEVLGIVLCMGKQSQL
jgi:hypothetical protein